jgi:endonuclease/exonuclease/phosphatase family metal-dependent hydrolase
MRLMNLRILIAFAIAVWATQALRAATAFSVATYNLENYLDVPAGHRPAKSDQARARIRESIRALNADVLALQEMGDTNALLELRAALRAEGLDYPHWEHVDGFDTNIHVAVLSKFPFAARRPHTNQAFLLNSRRFHVSRGFAELDIRLSDKYRLTLITAHLKSRREVPEADEADLRAQEAILLRRIIDARLESNPNINLVVLGDFNDLKDSKPVKVLIGHGKNALVDTRPAERNGDEPPGPESHFSAHNVTWTYHFGKDDTYSRVDYILISHGLAREWNTTGTYVLALPNWGQASDHRPVSASFFAEDE